MHDVLHHSTSLLSHRSALFVAAALTAWAGRQGEADPGPAGAGDAGWQGAGRPGVDAGGGGSGAADREGEAAAPTFSARVVATVACTQLASHGA